MPQLQPDEVICLVERAQRKDAAAFTELLRRYERVALSVAYGVLGDATSSGDVAQEAFLRAWEKLPDLKEPSRFGPWLCGVVRNLAIDARRRGKIQPRSNPDPDAAAAVDERWSPDPSDEIDRRERETLLRAAVGELDDISRSAVTLRYFEGMGSKEIGELLGLAPAAVDMRLSRACAQLRKKLEATQAFATRGEL